MRKSASITRRLTLAVLALELLAAIILIGVVTARERHIQFEAFDANIRATASSLLGAVQESDAKDGGVYLDLRGFDIPKRAAFEVSDEHGKVLGANGVLPSVDATDGIFEAATVHGQRFRFVMLSGDRVIDPGDVGGGVRHHITVMYGLPESHIWHEVFEAVRYFAIATLILLGVTALLLSWLVRRYLSPIRELAQEADKIDLENWEFQAPPSAYRFSELIPLASAIEKTIVRLHRAFQQQRRMTSDAAHELKTDTAIVKSSFQILTMKRRTVEEYEKGIALGVSDIERLEKTVGKMLTLARLEQSGTSEAQSCSIDEVLLDTLTQSQAFADVKRVRLTSSIQSADRVPVSREDANLLCSNVIVNAIQHSPENTEVHIRSRSESETVSITVRDQGRGVNEEDRPFLFDPFYRGDQSRNRKSGGTGLGLSICRAICDRANGSIRIENHPEGGALVTILLPSFSEDQRNADKPPAAVTA